MRMSNVVRRGPRSKAPIVMRGLVALAALALAVPSGGAHGVVVPLGRGAPLSAVAVPLGELTLLSAANDPLYLQQWSIPMMGVDRGWLTTMGSRSVVLAVIDTGVDRTHPDLAGASILPGYDAIDGSSDTSDTCGHGTATTGVIAAVQNNGIGIAGIANVSILPVKVMQLQPSGSCNGLFSTVAAGTRWAVDHGARILDFNLGCQGCFDQSMSDAIQYAMDHGVLMLAGAGNDGTCTDCVYWPASDPRVIGVGCVDAARARCSFSSQGPEVELAAPGNNIVTTLRGGSYSIFSGTSASGALASGVAALALSADPSLTADQLRARLDATAVDLGAAGRDPLYGYGLVDANATTLGAVPIDRPPSPLFVTGQVGLVVIANASTSFDAENDITTYAWAWGDGASGTGMVASHTYAAAGTYTITLTVTDAAGQATAIRHDVTVAPLPPPGIDQPPLALFNVTNGNLTANADARASYDPDGTITSYAWSWGDGATSAGVTASHTFATPGAYSIRLTVLDDAGLNATLVRILNLTLPAPVGPVANFTAVNGQLTVTADATGTTEVGGSIVSYSWAWGDGTHSVDGPIATHAYQIAGVFPITLIVTDDHGLTSMLTKSFIVVDERPKLHVLGIAAIARSWGSGAQATWTVTVANATGAPVASALVNATMSYVSSTTLASAQTARDGDAQLSLRTRLAGPYTLCVTSLALQGYAYDPSANLITCSTVSR
jgi:subtilisin family serine protease